MEQAALVGLNVLFATQAVNMAYASRDGTSNALRGWVGLVSFLQVQLPTHALFLAPSV